MGLVFKLLDPSKTRKRFTDEQRAEWERLRVSPAILGGSLFALGCAAVGAANWYGRTWAWWLWLLPAAISLVDIGVTLHRRRDAPRQRVSRALVLVALAAGLSLTAGLLRRWAAPGDPSQLGAIGWVIVGIQFTAIVLAVVAGFTWFRAAMREQEAVDKPPAT